MHTITDLWQNVSLNPFTSNRNRDELVNTSFSISRIKAFCLICYVYVRLLIRLIFRKEANRAPSFPETPDYPKCIISHDKQSEIDSKFQQNLSIFRRAHTAASSTIVRDIRMSNMCVCAHFLPRDSNWRCWGIELTFVWAAAVTLNDAHVALIKVLWKCLRRPKTSLSLPFFGIINIIMMLSVN